MSFPLRILSTFHCIVFECDSWSKGLWNDLFRKHLGTSFCSILRRSLKSFWCISPSTNSFVLVFRISTTWNILCPEIRLVFMKRLLFYYSISKHLMICPRVQDNLEFWVEHALVSYRSHIWCHLLAGIFLNLKFFFQTK